MTKFQPNICGQRDNFEVEHHPTRSTWVAILVHPNPPQKTKHVPKNRHRISSLLGRAALLGCILGIPEKSAALLVAAGGRSGAWCPTWLTMAHGPW